MAAIGGWLSFFRLATPSWSYDEPVYAAAGRAYSHGDYRPNPEHPPLVKDLIGASEQHFDNTVTADRLPSALALLCSGLLVWAWLRRTGPPASGPIAALLVWSLPVLTTFPEALDHPPADQTLARAGMLDAVAGGLALAAVAVGWWSLRSGRGSAAACCGLLSGLAVAAKFPAGLIVAVRRWPAASPRRHGAARGRGGWSGSPGMPAPGSARPAHRYRLVRTGPLDVWLRR